MSARSDALMWAQRITGAKQQTPEQLLGVPPGATLDDAQAAFHKIAKMAHPDLHRNALAADELELVTSAYAIVAGAYQTFRSRAAAASAKQTPPTGTPTKAESSATPAKSTRAHTPSSVPLSPSGPAPSGSALAAVAPRAVAYYRKAEISLRRGDLKGAVLQLKLAIAADPQSPLLRSALAEVEAELRKGS